MSAKWNNSVSKVFSPKNGVKQGSILSPVLFSVYLDKLLNALENHKTGCRIGRKFCGALAYADDLTLISPTVQGLQSMITLCEKFGLEYSIKFNDEKTE